MMSTKRKPALRAARNAVTAARARRYTPEGELDVSHLAAVAFSGVPGYRVTAFTSGYGDGGGSSGAVRARAVHQPAAAASGSQAGWNSGSLAAFDNDVRRARRADIEAQLLRAGDILKKLPMPREVCGLEKVCRHVEVIRDRSEHGAWDRDAGAATTRRPTSAEIAEVDQVLTWILWLSERERQAVWLFVSGLGLRRAAKVIGGVSHEAVRSWRNRGIDNIVRWVMEGRT